MKRTGEVILTIIGALLYGFGTLISFIIIWSQNNLDEIEQTLSQNEFQFTAAEINEMVEAIEMLPSGVIMLIASLVPIILGIVAIIFLKGNKNPKAAGIILIVTAVIFTLITFGGGILPGILFLIAGIMALVRKPKTILDE